MRDLHKKQKVEHFGDRCHQAEKFQDLVGYNRYRASSTIQQLPIRFQVQFNHIDHLYINIEFRLIFLQTRKSDASNTFAHQFIIEMQANKHQMNERVDAYTNANVDGSTQIIRHIHKYIDRNIGVLIEWRPYWQR